MRVGEAEVVGLVGGNGAGKTTLFDCITGLVSPQKGRVFFDGIDITRIAPHRRAHLGIARTFQGVEVFESLTVLEGVMVAAGLRARDRHDQALRGRAHAALAEVGIDDVASDAPAALPFATLRLTEIATALVADPSLVLLDEPLAGLDAAERETVLAAIARLRGQGRSVLIVEHDRASVEAIADRVYELHDGRAVERARVPQETPKPKPRARGKGAAVAARA
jgi:branched-chain amino acid transport system ATP-binding protein